MMNGVIFGGEGPVMSGTWYNPSTGDAFTVRDSFFEDNQYVVTTTDGRMLNYNQLQNYIQSDMKLEDLKKNKVVNNTKAEDIPSEVLSEIEGPSDPYASYMLPEDENILTKGLGNLNDTARERHLAPASAHQISQAHPVENMNYACIEKALKNAPMPKFNIKLEWKDYPTKNIEMLNDIMDIPTEEIVDWYLEKIDMLEIAENIKATIKDKFNCKEVNSINDIASLSKDLLPETKPKKTNKKSYPKESSTENK